MRRKADHLIPLEVSILEAGLALRRSGEEAFHGYALARAIRTAGDRRTLTAYGTLYRALHRLQRGRVLESFWEDPSEAEKEGRPRRRLYRLTALAEVALAQARAQERTARPMRALEQDPAAG